MRLLKGLDLKKVVHCEISCYGVSAKEKTNLEAAAVAYCDEWEVKCWNCLVVTI